MGNLIVEADPVFGGGHFRSSGVGTGGGTFEFIIDEVETVSYTHLTLPTIVGV